MPPYSWRTIGIGSATIVQQLTEMGLIDEYHLVLHPVILGSGKPLFIDGGAMRKLDLIENRPFENGTALLKYKPAAS